MSQGVGAVDVATHEALAAQDEDAEATEAEEAEVGPCCLLFGVPWAFVTGRSRMRSRARTRDHYT